MICGRSGDGLGTVWGQSGMCWGQSGNGPGTTWGQPGDNLGDGLGMICRQFGDGPRGPEGWSGDGLGMVWEQSGDSLGTVGGMAQGESRARSGDVLETVWGRSGDSPVMDADSRLSGAGQQPPAGASPSEASSRRPNPKSKGKILSSVLWLDF